MKIAVLLLAVLLPSPLLAQGLGDTAARERQKRAEKPPARAGEGLHGPGPADACLPSVRPRSARVSRRVRSPGGSLVARPEWGSSG